MFIFWRRLNCFKEVCLEENYTASLFTRFPKKQYIVEMHYAMTGIGSKKGFELEFLLDKPDT